MITAELNDWYKTGKPKVFIYWGHIHGDTRQRWVDGTLIHTSMVKDVKEHDDHFIVTTLNSIYKLPKDKARNNDTGLG